MARLIRSKCKLCRREGTKLFLRGTRCDSPKCSLAHHAALPGQRGAKTRTKRLSDYGHHLREKQKLKRIYGVLERQFKRYFQEAQRQTGNTGDTLLVLLERRLDNVLYQAGFATSKNQSRQLIAHGHVMVNNHKVNIPSYGVKPGDCIKPIAHETSSTLIKNLLTNSTRKDQIPSWLKLSEEPVEIRVVQLPRREDITVPINEQLVVEFSSR